MSTVLLLYTHDHKTKIRREVSLGVPRARNRSLILGLPLSLRFWDLTVYSINCAVLYYITGAVDRHSHYFGNYLGLKVSLTSSRTTYATRNFRIGPIRWRTHQERPPSRRIYLYVSCRTWVVNPSGWTLKVRAKVTSRVTRRVGCFENIWSVMWSKKEQNWAWRGALKHTRSG